MLVLGGLSAGALAAHALHAVGFAPLEGAHRFFEVDVYLGLLVLGALVCSARAVVVRHERLAWSAMALALIGWAAGDLASEIVWAADPPFPSIADVFYLAFYPFAYASLVLMVRSRFRKLELGVWLDGVVVGLAFAAVAAALIFKPILDATSGDSATVATTLAYPVGDLMLLVVVVAIFTMTGFRPGLPIAMIGVGLLITGFADGTYTYFVSTGSYETGGLLDSAWPAGMLLTAFAAWARSPRKAPGRPETLPIFGASAFCALIAVGLLVLDHFQRLTPLALWLAVAAIFLGLVRAVLSFAGKIRALRLAETQALARRADRARQPAAPHARPRSRARPGAGDRPRTLAFFDLDGFKQYNDSFGHPAGDSLLTRLGAAARRARRRQRRAYRLGGDEFCVLFDGDSRTTPRWWRASPRR